MQLTHEEAIQLIQHTTDRAAHGINEKLLHEHLKHCAQCSAYAREFKEMENVLQRVMQKHWNQRPAPFSISALKEIKKVQKSKSTLLVTRKAFISLAVMAFFFIGWQVTLLNNPTESLYSGLLPILTPSTQYTATNSLALYCQEILYTVQENDTLQSIADQYGASKDVILNANNMNTEVIQPGLELLVPVCDSTPTSTIYPPTFTITPILEPILYTPG